MIKPTDIRIGNVVHCELSDRDVIVEGISKSDNSYAGYYYVEYNGGSTTCIEDFDGDKYISGIPLTEEWLIKCPDAKKTDTLNYHLRMGATYLILRFNGGRCYCELPDRLYIGEIKSVHRLQNIIHSLSGQELIFNI